MDDGDPIPGLQPGGDILLPQSKDSSTKRAVSFNNFLSTGVMWRQGDDINSPSPFDVQRLNVHDPNNPLVNQIRSTAAQIVREVALDQKSPDPEVAKLQTLYKKASWSTADRVEWERNLTELASRRVQAQMSPGDYRTVKGGQDKVVTYSDLSMIAQDEGQATKRYEWDCKEQSAVKGAVTQMTENTLLKKFADGTGKSPGVYYEMTGFAFFGSNGGGAHAYVVSSKTGNILEATSDQYEEAVGGAGPETFRKLVTGTISGYGRGKNDFSMYASGHRTDDEMKCAFNVACTDPAYLAHSLEWISNGLKQRRPLLDPYQQMLDKYREGTKNTPDPDGKRAANIARAQDEISHKAVSNINFNLRDIKAPWDKALHEPDHFYNAKTIGSVAAEMQKTLDDRSRFMNPSDRASAQAAVNGSIAALYRDDLVQLKQMLDSQKSPNMVWFNTQIRELTAAAKASPEIWEQVKDDASKMAVDFKKGTPHEEALLILRSPHETEKIVR